MVVERKSRLFDVVDVRWRGGGINWIDRDMSGSGPLKQALALDC